MATPFINKKTKEQTLELNRLYIQYSVLNEHTFCVAADIISIHLAKHVGCN